MKVKITKIACKFVAKSVVIRNGKTENLAKLDVYAFFISNAFFKSASPVDTGHKFNVHKTFRRRLM